MANQMGESIGRRYSRETPKRSLRHQHRESRSCCLCQCPGLHCLRLRHRFLQWRGATEIPATMLMPRRNFLMQWSMHWKRSWLAAQHASMLIAKKAPEVAKTSEACQHLLPTEAVWRPLVVIQGQMEGS